LVFSKDRGGETPLHGATFMGHQDVAELLLANKAKANSDVTPLHWAEYKGCKDMAKFSAPVRRSRIDIQCDGLHLLPELYAHLNSMPFEAAARMEQHSAEDLRGAGYTVTGGH
jgi:Ankyrin repeats (3 copies)